MKAPIDAKVDGSKQQQQQAGPALFPRLHVAETKRMGPRAPPRNKMALYEQFTIPVKRFSSSPVPPLSATQNAFNNPPMSPVLVPGLPPQVIICLLFLHRPTSIWSFFSSTFSFVNWAGTIELHDATLWLLHSRMRALEFSSNTYMIMQMLLGRCISLHFSGCQYCLWG